VADFVDYFDMVADVAVASLPDGQLFGRELTSRPTPGAINQASVAKAPDLGASMAPDGSLNLAWPSVTGVRYRLEYRDTLSAPWQLLGEFVATGVVSGISVATDGRDESYYRLVVP
jgi:hypothetical protein